MKQNKKHRFHYSLLFNCTLFSILVWQNVAYSDELSIGAGVFTEKKAYRNYDRKTYPIPIINYDNQYIFIKGTSIGAYAINTSNDKLFATVAYLSDEFKNNKTSNESLKKLNNRKLSIMAGVGYHHNADWGNIYAHAMTDISGKSHGIITDIAYGYAFKFENLYFEPKIGVEWQNRKYNDYYFGISQLESNRNRLNHYSAHSGSMPYLSLNSHYIFNAHWHTFLSARYTKLSNSIKKSAMTSSSSTNLIGVGILYRF